MSCNRFLAEVYLLGGCESEGLNFYRIYAALIQNRVDYGFNTDHTFFCGVVGCI